MVDEDCKRGSWPKAVVTRYRDLPWQRRQSIVRRVRVKTAGSTSVRDVRRKLSSRDQRLMEIYVCRGLKRVNTFLWFRHAPFAILLVSTQGRIQERGAIVPPKTNESNFIHHDFAQFGKQYSRYKGILPSTVLSQQCCEAYFISLAVVNPWWYLTKKFYWNRPPP